MKKVILIIKKVQIGCLAIVLLAVFMGCSKDKKILIGSSWKVVSIKANENSEKEYNHCNGGEVYLCIGEDIFYLMSSWDCQVSGKVRVGNSKISFLSDYVYTGLSNKFMEDCGNLLIDKIDHYEIYGHKLVLTGKKGAEINLVVYL